MASVGRRSAEGAYFLHNGTLYSPIGFMFAVDRRSVHMRSLQFLEANYRMCKYGVRVLPEGWVDHAPSTQMPAQNANGFGGKSFCYNPLIWGHVNERLPMHLFGHEFIERPAPACIIEGQPKRHVDMNCSQPTTPPNRGLPRSTLASNAADLVVVPQGRPWCKPLDNCGSTG